MYIYLDESGDLGFDFSKSKTTRYFVITLLVCDDKDAQDGFIRAVKRTLKNKLNHKKKGGRQAVELKGTNTSQEIKEYFYRQVPDNGWCLYSIALDKRRVSFQHRSTTGKKQLYNHVARTLLEKVEFPVSPAKVHLFVDRSKNQAEIKEFNEYLINHLVTVLPLNSPLAINHPCSHEMPGLQAVDLFCWGIFRKENNGDSAWYDFYKGRLRRETRFSVLQREG
jgi:hypothetical protein